jgi:hypothetical protein
MVTGVPVVRAQTAVPGIAIDTVSITMDGTGANVEQGIPSALGVIEAYAIRLPGQTLTVTEVVAEGGRLDPSLFDADGAVRIGVASLADVVLRYRIEGALERIPLFVSGGGAVVTVAHGLEEPYLIRLTAAAETLREIDTDTSMPRFVRTADGGLEARLSSLPSFVRLSSGGPFSFARIADAVALLMILGGAAFAFRRLRA